MLTQNKRTKKQVFSLIFNNNYTEKTIWNIKFNKIDFSIFITCIIVLLSVGITSLIVFTPLKTLIPGYTDEASKKLVIENAIKLDSLEKLIYRWELYSENFRTAVEGDRTVRIDSIIKLSKSDSAFTANKEELRIKDSILRENVKEIDRFEVSRRNIKKLPIESTIFFTPIKGVVSQGYNEVSHPYIDITAPANSTVMSVLDGAVIYTDWSNEFGYTIHVQHDNDIISIYKHNEKLLKNIGDKVSAGSPIAIIGNTGTISTGVHLHFELWYKGEAVNPTNYINF